MHFDEVYHARTATEFLQDWRYGAVARHLRVDPSAPRQVRDGRRARAVGRGRRQRRRATSASRSARRPSSRAARTSSTGERAGERVHVATGDGDPDLRPADARARSATIAAPGARRPGRRRDREPARRRLDDGSVATLDLTRIGLGGVDIGLEPTALGHVGHPVTHLLVTEDGATILAASDDQLDGARRRIRARSPGTSTCPGIADLSPGGTGPTLVATPSRDRGPGGRRPRPAGRAARRRRRATTRRAWPRTPDADGRSSWASRATARSGRRSTRRSRPASCPAIEVADVVAGRGRDGRRRRVHRPRDAPRVIDDDRAGRRRPRPGLVTASTTRGCTSRPAPPDDPSYDVIAVGGDAAKDGPVTTAAATRCPASGTRVACDDATPEVHILGRVRRPPAATRAAGRLDGLRRRAARPNAVYADARLPPGFDPAAWAIDVEAQYPVDDRQQLLVFGADGRDAPRSRPARTPSPGGCPG